MKNHILKNQYDKYITGKDNKNAIYLMLDQRKDKALIDGRMVEVKSDFRKNDERITVLHIEGI